MIDLVLWQFVYLPALLIVGYVVGIQYERGGWWRIFYVVAAGATVLDAWLNYTTLALYTWDFPQKSEYTFTKRLNRMKKSTTWRASAARIICRVLDYIAPSGCHCKP